MGGSPVSRTIQQPGTPAAAQASFRGNGLPLFHRRGGRAPEERCGRPGHASLSGATDLVGPLLRPQPDHEIHVRGTQPHDRVPAHLRRVLHSLWHHRYGRALRAGHAPPSRGTAQRALSGRVPGARGGRTGAVRGAGRTLSLHGGVQHRLCGRTYGAAVREFGRVSASSDGHQSQAHAHGTHVPGAHQLSACGQRSPGVQRALHPRTRARAAQHSVPHSPPARLRSLPGGTRPASREAQRSAPWPLLRSRSCLHRGLPGR